MTVDHVAVMDQDGGLDEQVLKDRKERVRRYRKRLQAREVFVLPEVWDVASARLMADAGFDLIGISSVSLAWSLGMRPDERLSLQMLTELACRIAGGMQVPVTADLEGAANRSPEEISQAVGRVIGRGCVGVTIGDGGRGGAQGIVPIQEMTAVIRSAKAAALEARVPAVITARTEAFLLEPLQHSPFETAVERAEAYFAAGADCISVPGVQHVQIIERLSGVIDGPLCVTIGLTPAPDVKALGNAGAACVALGSSLFRSLLGTMRLKAEELVAFGHFSHLDKAIPADELENLLR